MFVGFAVLDTTFHGMVLVRAPDEAPAVASSPPTYRVYGPGGLMANGTGTTEAVVGSIGLYQYAIEAAGSDGYELGETYRILFDFMIGGDSFVDQQTFLVT